jgi:hypothetical protein
LFECLHEVSLAQAGLDLAEQFLADPMRDEREKEVVAVQQETETVGVLLLLISPLHFVAPGRGRDKLRAVAVQ